MIGMSHRNPGDRRSAAGRVDDAGLARPPSARTVSPGAPKVTATVPSRSVRKTRAPASAKRPRVARAGWP